MPNFVLFDIHVDIFLFALFSLLLSVLIYLLTICSFLLFTVLSHSISNPYIFNQYLFHLNVHVCFSLVIYSICIHSRIISNREILLIFCPRTYSYCLNIFPFRLVVDYLHSVSVLFYHKFVSTSNKIISIYLRINNVHFQYFIFLFYILIAL